jgi:hypothetical protein
LDQVCRHTDDQVIFKGTIECLPLGWMNELDEARLWVLTLDDYHYTLMEPYNYSPAIKKKMDTMNTNYARQ